MPKNQAEKLNNLLSALESDVAECSDKELLAAKESVGMIRSVRSIIDKQLANYEFEPPAGIPEDAEERRRLLQLMARSGSAIPAEIRMTFSKDEHVSDKKVSDLLAQVYLARHLKKPGSSKK